MTSTFSTATDNGHSAPSIAIDPSLTESPIKPLEASFADYLKLIAAKQETEEPMLRITCDLMAHR